MNTLNSQAKQRQTHRQRADDSQWGEKGVEGLSKKEKELMDADHRVVIAGGQREVRGLNGNGKNTIKIIYLKKFKFLVFLPSDLLVWSIHPLVSRIFNKYLRKCFLVQRFYIYI